MKKAEAVKLSEQALAELADALFDNTVLNTVMLNIVQPYDPAAGAIESLSYSGDSLGISRSSVNSSSGRVALRQDGFMYLSGTTFTPADSATEFGSNTLNNLDELDFQAIINGTIFPTANPDFSSSGSVIEFGWQLSRTGRGRVFVNDTLGFDNFRVELTTEEIPEPSTVVLLLLSAIGVSVACRQR